MKTSSRCSISYWREFRWSMGRRRLARMPETNRSTSRTSGTCWNRRSRCSRERETRFLRKSMKRKAISRICSMSLLVSLLRIRRTTSNSNTITLKATFWRAQSATSMWNRRCVNRSIRITRHCYWRSFRTRRRWLSLPSNSSVCSSRTSCNRRFPKDQASYSWTTISSNLRLMM